MMKMNTKNFGRLVLLAALVIGVILISGCVQQAPEKEQTEGPEAATEEQPLVNPYDSARELTPTGESAKNINDQIKPILVSVFGGAKLTFEVTEGFATTVTYTVKRPVVQEDAPKLVEGLKSLMEGKGYKHNVIAQYGEGFVITYKKEETGAETVIATNKQEVVINYH